MIINLKHLLSTNLQHNAKAQRAVQKSNHKIKTTARQTLTSQTTGTRTHTHQLTHTDAYTPHIQVDNCSLTPGQPLRFYQDNRMEGDTDCF